MQETNSGFPTKYKPTERLLWCKLQIALIKVKERRNASQHTVQWCLLLQKHKQVKVSMLTNVHHKKYFQLLFECQNSTLYQLKVTRFDDSSFLLKQRNIRIHAYHYPQEAIVPGCTWEKQKKQKTKQAGRSSVMVWRTFYWRAQGSIMNEQLIRQRLIMFKLISICMRSQPLKKNIPPLL